MTDSDQITSSINRIIEQEIVSRFGRLHEDDSWKKADGELVTRADLAAEERITELLRGVRPGSIVIGEEAVSHDETLIDAVNGPSVWIVDPLDSTMNFRNGDPNFSTLVSYCEGGEVLASWTFIPMRNLVAYAAKGQGAFINKFRLQGRAVLEREPFVSVTHSAFRTEADKALFDHLSSQAINISESRGAGIEYVAMMEGSIDATVFTWEKAWDHAAGSLFVNEAGGRHSCRDGTKFCLSGGNQLPLVAAWNHDLWLRTIALLEMDTQSPKGCESSHENAQGAKILF